MNQKNLQQSVIDEFSSANAQKAYREKALNGLWKSEKELIDKYFIQDGKVLDIGCGTGRTTISLQKLGFEVIGIDITPKMIESAKEIAAANNLKIDYRIGDAGDLKFEDESFENALFSNQGWTQIPDKENRQQAINEIYRILKPGGIYIFPFHLRQVFSKRFFFWAWQWLKLNVLKRMGFRIEEIDFGDRFFKRESSGLVHETKQYIHIASIPEVEKQVKKAGFEILHIGQGISEQSGSKPIFVVCRK